MDEEQNKERNRWEDRNKESRMRLESEYFEVKNLAIILIDLVPYERKAEMIEGLKRLFHYDKLTTSQMLTSGAKLDMIPDMKEKGQLLGGEILKQFKVVSVL